MDLILFQPFFFSSINLVSFFLRRPGGSRTRRQVQRQQFFRDIEATSSNLVLSHIGLCHLGGRQMTGYRLLNDFLLTV